MIGVKDGAARLEPHSKEWETAAEETIRTLRALLGGLIVDIQHVGSTSVPELAAKPIIDIEVGVTDLQAVKDKTPLLEKNGFYYRPRTETASHVLYACRDIERGMDTHYIHVVLYGSREWNDNIKFRDALRENPAVRKEYEDLKFRLACEYPEDRATYTKLKEAFILRIMNG